MSKRTQRRAEQRRVNRIAREQNTATEAAKLPNAETQSDHEMAPNEPEAKAAPACPPATHTSPAQIAANRENAKHSTGPTSETGKATVSQNRTVHGLNYNPNTFRVLACEDQSVYDSLVRQLSIEHNPADTTETILVTTMAQHRWLLDRANRLQDSCFNQETGEIADQKSFSLYLRYATTHERAFHKCLTDLLKLRATRQKLEIGFESEKRRVDRHQHFLDGKQFDLFMKEMNVHFRGLDLRRAERIAVREEKAQTAA